MDLGEVELREAGRAPAQRREVLQPALVTGRVVRPEPAEPEQVAGEAPHRLRRVEMRIHARRPLGGGPRADRPAQPALAPDSRHRRVGGQPLRVLGDAFRRQVGSRGQLVLPAHVDERDVLVAEAAHARALPRRAVPERAVGPVPDLRRVEEAVLVLDVDGCGARSVGGDGEVAVGERNPLQQGVAATEPDATVDDHLGVPAQLVGLHRPGHANGS